MQKSAHSAKLSRDIPKINSQMNSLERLVSQYFKKKGLPAKYLRRWNYSLPILQGVPESVADFIQGRASITLCSMLYLAEVKHIQG